MNEVRRVGVFETNSSSTHSISIVGGEFTTDHLPIDGGVCAIYPGEFGWDVETFYDAATKASYLLTYAKGAGTASDGLLDMLHRVVAAEMGVAVEFCPMAGYYDWGYIDHQSGIGGSDVGADAFASEDAMRAFIFNRASYLHTDNDNH